MDALPVLYRLYLWPKRIRYRRDARTRDIARADAVAAIRKRFDEAERLGMKNFRCVFNTALYVLLLDEDLSMHARDFFLTNSKRRRAFVARHLAMTLYEASEDIPRLIGRDFRTAIRLMGGDDSWTTSLNGIASEINQFKSSHQQLLRSIRNAAAAHRDLDCAQQLAVLDTLDPMAIFRLTGEFTTPAQRLVHLLTQVTLHTGNLRTMLRELAGRSGGT